MHPPHGASAVHRACGAPGEVRRPPATPRAAKRRKRPRSDSERTQGGGPRAGAGGHGRGGTPSAISSTLVHLSPNTWEKFQDSGSAAIPHVSSKFARMPFWAKGKGSEVPKLPKADEAAAVLSGSTTFRLEHRGFGGERWALCPRGGRAAAAETPERGSLFAKLAQRVVSSIRNEDDAHPHLAVVPSAEATQAAIFCLVVIGDGGTGRSGGVGFGAPCVLRANVQGGAVLVRSPDSGRLLFSGERATALRRRLRSHAPLKGRGWRMAPLWSCGRAERGGGGLGPPWQRGTPSSSSCWTGGRLGRTAPAAW